MSYVIKIVCGGTGSKGNIDQIHLEAKKRTNDHFEDLPCGCEWCYAKLLLECLAEVRIMHGLDPETGRTKE